MWKVNNVQAKNFISFKSLDLDVPQDNCSLIYGQNNDNAQQKNNGTGKSSIVEAICFALTGESMRGVKDAELINDNADKAIVTLTLENDYDGTLFEIERILDRNNPQRIICHKYDADDNEIEVEKTTQATVLDYNRYILDEIGLSKDDLYSSYILSNSRYESFFNASDKAKKAMINRFSGADAVDKSIEALKADMAPIEEKLNKAKEAKIAVEAKIEAVESQIADSEAKKEEFAANKQKRIEDIDNRIAEKRAELRSVNEVIDKANERLKQLKEILLGIEEIENSSNGLETDYTDIQMLFEDAKLDKMKNFVQESQSTQLAIQEYEDKKKALQEDCKSAEKALENLRKCYDLAKEEADKVSKDKESADKEDKLDLTDVYKEIEDAKEGISELGTKISECSDRADKLHRQIRQLKNMLHGAITCPKCKHSFFLNEERSVAEVNKELETTEKDWQKAVDEGAELENKVQSLTESKQQLECERDEIKADLEKRETALQTALSKARSAMRDVEEGESGIESLQNRIKRLEDKIQTEQAKLENISKTMFEDANDIVENAIEKGNNYITIQNDKITAINSAISTFESAKKEAEKGSADDLIASLNDSKAKYQKELQTALNALSEVQEEYDKFVLQEAHFTQFKSHLANRKIEAIAGVTNTFLERIGSDLRVELLGFKVLRTGKLRDKITVNLLRNGVLCGSYGKFSGGEKARVNLASILALQKLTNNAADKGKGLDLLILDEILEASDTTGIESCCDALNKLKVSALLVTQNPVVDYEGDTIVVVKENGFSHIKEQYETDN